MKTINVKYLYGNKHWKINEEYNIDKILYLMIDRPNKIHCNSHITWHNNKGQCHRNYDLPAYIIYNGNNETCRLYWRKNNKPHRNNNKPAFIGINGYKQYYINGKYIKSEWLR